MESAQSQRARRGTKKHSDTVPSTSTSLPLPGPSGIKQCFRTVKSARRITPAVKPPHEPLPPPSRSSRPLRKKTVKESPTPPNPQFPQPPKTFKKHGCRCCNKKFTSPGKLSQHVLSHTGELPYACQHCDKRFNSKFKLVRHKLIHSETRPFACSRCDKTFHRKDHLSNHERVHDPVKKLYVCERPDCKKRYASLLCFRKHAALHSAEEGDLDCKICSETFQSRDEIVYHLKVHAGSRTVKNETDKKFKCQHCERKFFTGKDVRRHLVVHTGRRDFICQFCPQKFGRKDHLVRHVKKTHPGESWQSVIPSSSSAVPDILDVSEQTPARRKRNPETGSTIDVKTEEAPKEETIEECVFDFDDDGVEFGAPVMKDPRSSFSDSVKNEPAMENPEMQSNLKSDYRQIIAQKPMPPVDLADVSPGPSGVSSKYPDYIYMMSPPSYSLNKEGLEMIEDTSLLSEMSVPVMSEDSNALRLLDQPVESILMNPEDTEESLARQGILDFLKSSMCDQQVQEQQTGLPRFDQAFQTIQNPKPPRRPSER